MIDFIKGYFVMIGHAIGPFLLLLSSVTLCTGWIYGTGWAFTVLAVPMNPLTVVLFISLLCLGVGIICSFFHYLSEYRGWI